PFYDCQILRDPLFYSVPTCERLPYRTKRRVSIILSFVQQFTTRSTWPGRPAHRRPKGRKGPQHAGPSQERWEAGANQATVSRDPPGMVKARWLEARSSSDDLLIS